MTDKVYSVIGGIILCALSCFFSGLTHGFLSLDPVSLEIVARGDTPNAKFAQDILPLRALGNKLLCTLLLGNVAVNSGLTILLVNWLGSWSAFAIATATILFLGELIPQSICGPYSLHIASKVTLVVYLLVYAMYPIIWPISKVLDWALGQDLGLVYTNRELQNLVNIHEKNGSLPSISAGIMKGALDFSKLTVERVMTDWKDVFFLRSDALLDFITLEKIFKSGHSRVPVLNTRKTQLDQVDSVCPVIGLLFVKDLILLDPEDELPLQYIIDNFRHDLKHVDFGDTVARILDDFRHGRSHLAIVQKRSENMVNGMNIYENVGIITLEDILENILKMEISDEFDIDLKQSRRNDDALRFFDYRRIRGMDNLPPQERNVVFRHLCKEVKVFMLEHRKADEVDLQNLLESATIWKIILDVEDINHENYHYKNNAMIEDGGHILYRQGLQSEFFTFILDGKAEIFSGRQKFRTEVSRFTILFPELLTNTQKDYEQGFELSDFVPDFTARVIQSSRILRISRANFLKCLQGKLKNYIRPSKVIAVNESDRCQNSKFVQFEDAGVNRPADCSNTHTEHWRGLNTVAPGFRSMKMISPARSVDVSGMSQTKYMSMGRVQSDSKLCVSNSTHINNVKPTGEKIVTLDMVELRSGGAEEEKVGISRSDSRNGGSMSDAASALTVRTISGPNSNH